MKLYKTNENIIRRNANVAPIVIQNRTQGMGSENRDVMYDSMIFKDVGSVLKDYRSLMEIFYSHPFLHGSLMQIAKVISGSGFDVVLSDINSKIKEEEKEKLSKPIYNLFNNKFVREKWTNIKDYVTFTEKIKMTVLYILLYNQAGWEVIRDGRGGVIGFDFINGLIIPNVDSMGYFKSPAWFVFPFGAESTSKYVSYDNPEDIVLFTRPAVDGKFYGKFDINALMEFTIPADIYAVKSYLGLHKNVNSPAGIWMVEDMETEDFDDLAAMIRSHYRGTDNYGASAIVVNKQVDFKEFRAKSKDDAPYLEGRNFAKGETASVTGVPTSKLGISEDVDKSDLQSMRRDFYESTVRPITNLIEETINNQIISRYFSTTEVRFQFKQPDFLTALERSIVAGRLYQAGSMNPNEIRGSFLNLPPRKGGDKYYEEIFSGGGSASPPFGSGKTMTTKPAQTEQGGSPAEDRAPGEKPKSAKVGDIGTKKTTTAPTVKNSETGKILINRGDYNNIVEELLKWEKFTRNIITEKRNKRNFNFEYVPNVLSDAINDEMNLMVWQQPEEQRLVNFMNLSAIVSELILTFYDVIESVDKETINE